MIGITPGQAIASGYGHGHGHGHGDNFCSQTARSVFHACHFDVLDDFNETKANCINIDDEDERELCVADSREAKREDWKGCKEQRSARLDVCDLIGEDRYADPLKDPYIEFVNPDDIGNSVAPNQYVNMTKGHTYVLRAGEGFEETVIVHVTDEIREAEGAYEEKPVLCRVVVDVALVLDDDGEREVEELTDDYFAQDAIGNVYYCGEISRNYEDGYLDNLDGSFFSGVEYAKAGVLMRQFPSVGQVERQEYAIAEAEDVVEYLDLSAAPSGEVGDHQNPKMQFECMDNGNVDGDCLKTLDSAALDPEDTEYKYYLKNVGFVLAVALEDGEITGEREELVCVGNDLSVLYSPECELGGDAAVDELLEKLCELSPNAFCPVDDD